MAHGRTTRKRSTKDATDPLIDHELDRLLAAAREEFLKENGRFLTDEEVLACARSQREG